MQPICMIKKICYTHTKYKKNTKLWIRNEKCAQGFQKAWLK